MSEWLGTLAGAPSRRLAERRFSPRYSLAGKAIVHGCGGGAFQAKVRNISLNGCYLATRKMIPLQSCIVVHMEIGGVSMAFPAKVRRTDGGGLGVQFDGEPVGQN